MVIVNQKRQIVAANAATRTLLCAQSGDLLGKRPGEAINCIHAAEAPDGCGGSSYCTVCQAVQAVLLALEWGGPVRRDARLSLETRKAPRRRTPRHGHAHRNPGPAAGHSAQWKTSAIASGWPC